MRPEPAFFDLVGASAFCGLSVRTLRRLISQPDGLPYHRIGSAGKILISKVDLEAFLAKHRRKPVDFDRLASEVVVELRGRR